MDFGEKLRQLAKGRNKSDLARAAGLTPTVISNYINRGSVPRADIALKIALAVNVPLDWLVDDEQDWPPPRPARPHVEQLTDRELMMELATRYRRAALDYIEAQNATEKIDWNRASEEIEKLSPDDPLPDLSRRAHAAMVAINTTFARMQNAFDLPMFSALHHESLPGGDRPLSDFDLATSGFRFGWFEDREAVARFGRALAARPEYRESPAARELNEWHTMQRAYYARFKELGEGRKAAQPKTDDTGRAKRRD